MEIRIQSTGQVMTESEFRSYQKSIGGPTWDQTTPEVLKTLKADPVFEGPQASGGTVYQYSMRQGVEQHSDGKWYTKYVLGPVFTDPAQEVQYRIQKDAEQAKAIRATRNKLLSDCDWTQLSDSPTNKDAWATYRQQLRDLPKQIGFPWNVTWPTQP